MIMHGATVEKRAQFYMSQKASEWPDSLRDYVNHTCREFGVCSEVVLGGIRRFCEVAIPGNEWDTDADQVILDDHKKLAVEAEVLLGEVMDRIDRLKYIIKRLKGE